MTSTSPEASARDRERRRLLDATLPHVSCEGWTRTAIGMGAEDAGMVPGESARLFPGGPAEMVSFFVSQGDRAMLDELSRIDLDSMRVRERIAAAVRIRLSLAAGQREAVLKAVVLQAGPPGFKSLYRTVDAIWRVAGDTATDFNFYTKRILLAGVYTSTLLCWLDDNSQDHEATWEFLDRRIGNVMALQKLRGRTWLPRPASVIARMAHCRRPFSRRASQTAS